MPTTPPHADHRAAGITLDVRGRVTSSVCRTTRSGAPVVEVEIADIGSGQVVAITHRYPNASAASTTAARALAAHLRGQHITTTAINPRFKARRLECEADIFNTPALHTVRTDIDA